MISIIIPIHDDIRFLDLVRSLQKAGIERFKNSVRVILALNQPSNEVEVICRDLQKEFLPKLVVTVTTPEKGIGVAKNTAIEEYINKSSYFCFLDSDCLVDETYLDKLTDLLVKPKNTPLAVRGYVKFVPEFNTLVSRLNCSLRQSSYDINKNSYLSPNLILSASIFKKVGIYRTDIRFGDDLEFGQRAILMARPVFYGELKIIHRDDPRFISKTLITMWGYGRDRGFRISRRIRLGQYTILKAIIVSFIGQRYWLKLSPTQVIFCLLYLVTSRISTFVYVASNLQKNREYFLTQTLPDNSRWEIDYLPNELDLP